MNDSPLSNSPATGKQRNRLDCMVQSFVSKPQLVTSFSARQHITRDPMICRALKGKPVYLTCGGIWSKVSGLNDNLMYGASRTALGRGFIGCKVWWV